MLNPMCLKKALQKEKVLETGWFQGLFRVPSRIRTDDIQNHNLTL